MITCKEADPKGLIRESYLMEGISDGECRSIFTDWALSLPANVEPPPALSVLIEVYAGPNPDHPMSLLLHAAQSPIDAPRRRGGRATRVEAHD